MVAIVDRVQARLLLVCILGIRIMGSILHQSSYLSRLLLVGVVMSVAYEATLLEIVS